ncbi:hypothetical protein MKW98_025229 [Papaver atlanticum]|uniref:Peptidase A1 domain-containing protein n=1 Tax=Papaver atlanticum TaxID=357466 RepID=A0AAD4S2S9_9MAGN|nr:hypothetical protein MKW98_025229 [Papaver atlanticum]
MRNPYIFFFALVLVLSWIVCVSGGGGVFQVNHKFGKKNYWSLTDLKVHDTNRHAAINVPLAQGHGIYYTKLAIGSPPRDYFLIVDTGSDVFLVTCAKCAPCYPTYTDSNPTLNYYDPKLSSTSSLVPCSSSSNKVCGYNIGYGDGSTSTGYFVRDIIGYDQISGDFQTTIRNADVSFGCGMKVTGNLGNLSLDGLIGFGASSTSFLSHLASEGKVSKKFAHCLDGRNGGGIFVIGDIVGPPLKMTPLIPNGPLYNVIMKSIQVGNSVLDISQFEAGEGKGTIVDSGTTLAYLPGPIFNPLRLMILTSQVNLSTRIVNDHYGCFEFHKSLDDSFPSVTLSFENSLELKVYPHDYLIPNHEWYYCLGWQDSRRLKSDLIILGDLVLNNKLVLYDLENQALRVSECSSTIGLKDEESGAIYQAGGSNNLSSYPTRYNKHISSSPAQHFGRVIQLVLLSFMLYNCV